MSSAGSGARGGIPVVHAGGDNYRIELLPNGLIVCTVWSRSDLDWSQGAAMAELMVDAIVILAQRPAHALLFDLSEAPPLFGPRTEAALARGLSAWEQAGRPVAVQIGSSGIQRLQIERVSREHAPKVGKTFSSKDEAQAWLLADLKRLSTEVAPSSGPRSKK